MYSTWVFGTIITLPPALVACDWPGVPRTNTWKVNHVEPSAEVEASPTVLWMFEHLHTPEQSSGLGALVVMASG
jgi:hypothetical protein